MGRWAQGWQYKLSTKGKEGINGDRNKQHKNGYHKPMIPRQPKFEGKCDDLKGRIYDCALWCQTVRYLHEDNKGDRRIRWKDIQVWWGHPVGCWESGVSYQLWSNQVTHLKTRSELKKGSGKSKLMSLSREAATLLRMSRLYIHWCGDSVLTSEDQGTGEIWY